MLRAKASATIAVLLAPLATASAQDWPTRAVTMVVPTPRGARSIRWGAFSRRA